MAENKFAGLFDQTFDAPDAKPMQSPTPKKAVGRPPGKRSDPAYKQYAFLLKRDIHRRVETIIRDEGHPDMSELIELLERWLTEKGQQP